MDGKTGDSTGYGLCSYAEISRAMIFVLSAPTTAVGKFVIRAGRNREGAFYRVQIVRTLLALTDRDGNGHALVFTTVDSTRFLANDWILINRAIVGMSY